MPVNDALDALDLRSSTSDAVERRRATCDRSWNRWHHLRTIASVGMFALAAAVALVAADDS